MRHFKAIGLPQLPNAPLQFRQTAWMRTHSFPTSHFLYAPGHLTQCLLRSRWCLPFCSPSSQHTPLWAIHTRIPTNLHSIHCGFLCLAVLPCWSGNYSLITFQDPAQISNFGETIYSIMVSCSLFTLLYYVNFQTDLHLSVSSTGSWWEQGLNASHHESPASGKTRYIVDNKFKLKQANK